MTTEEKAKAYDEALEKIRPLYEQAKKDGNPIWSTYEYLVPELRKEEKPLTSFQQCLNCILRGVYYAEVPDEEVNEFILNVVRARTDELIKLAKRHEHTDCQLHENEDERIRKYLIEELKVSETIGELKFRIPYPTREECIAYLEKQKEQKHPNGCFTCDEYKKGYEEGRRNGFTAGYNKAMKEVEQKEQKPAEWSEKDEKMRNLAIEWAETMSGQFSFVDMDATDFRKIATWLKSIRPQPKQEWSEEDADMLNCCISSIEEAKENRYAYKETDGDTSYDREIAFLKSLRPSWKPSEEQMEALLWCTAHLGGADRRVLAELYEHLKMYCK